ncbi:MAG: phage minor head protein [Sphingorhabdus sp.]
MAEPEGVDIPLLPFAEAIAFFQGKGLAKSFAWQDIMRSQHDYYFTVAKMLSRSLLEDTYRLIADALENGESAEAVRRSLKKRLKEAGWWGKKVQKDPLTGEEQEVQLGSDRRVRTIVNTNLRTSYSAGRYARQERTRKTFPILVYKSRMDGRERPQHHAWHNTALPFDDPWWETHTGPCDWGCRCYTVSMTAKMAERRGLKVGDRPQSFGTRKWVNKRTGEVHEIEKGIGAGWDYHPGKSQLSGLAPEPLFPFSTAEDDALASAMSERDKAFLAAFGLADPGGVFIDDAGFPLPVTPRWLAGLGRKGNAAALQAAETIVQPDSIRHLWVKGKDGSLLLARRYIRKLGRGWSLVDVHSDFWRFGVARQMGGGVTVWQRPSDQDA